MPQVPSPILHSGHFARNGYHVSSLPGWKIRILDEPFFVFDSGVDFPIACRRGCEIRRNTRFQPTSSPFCSPTLTQLPPDLKIGELIGGGAPIQTALVDMIGHFELQTVKKKLQLRFFALANQIYCSIIQILHVSCHRKLSGQLVRLIAKSDTLNAPPEIDSQLNIHGIQTCGSG